MKLQLALDRVSREECFSLVEQTASSIDWIEIGTGVIKEYGMDIIREMKAAYPDKTIVADMKTCDAAASETRQALDAGADITTVMAFAADSTINAALDEAAVSSKRVMIDLLGVTDLKRFAELDALGVDLVSMHIGKDMQSEGGISGEHFSLLQDYPHWDAAAAGGINEKTIPDLVGTPAEIFIVGGAITKAENPEAAAENIQRLVKP